MIVLCAECNTRVGFRPGTGSTCFSKQGHEVLCDKCRDKHSEPVCYSIVQIHLDHGVAVSDFSYAGM